MEEGFCIGSEEPSSPSETGTCLILLKRSTINYFPDEWSTILLIEDS